jgi:hypothetical protein
VKQLSEMSELLDGLDVKCGVAEVPRLLSLGWRIMGEDPLDEKWEGDITKRNSHRAMVLPTHIRQRD